jgi:hypothetical protein
VPKTPSARELFAAAGIFTLASLVFTFPLVTALGQANRLDSPDALLNGFIVSWNLEQLRNDPLHLFDANIFFPEKGALAYSENLLTASLIAAPVALVSDNPILLVNIVLLAAFVFSGLAAFALAFELTHDRLAAYLAGILFTFAPYRFAHLPHLQLQLAFGVPLSFVLVRWLVAGRGRLYATVGFALAALLTFGSSVYYTVYVASAVPIVALTELYWVPQEKRRRALGQLLVGGVLAVVLVMPLVLPYRAKLQSGRVRSLQTAAEFSAGLHEYLSSFSWLHAFLPKANEPLFPGFVALTLAATALLTAGRERERKWCWVAVGLLGVALSLGPSLGLFTFLYNVAAPYRALRVPSRAGVLFLLAVALLAAIGLTRVKRPVLRWALVIVAALECLVAPLVFQMEAPSYPAIYRHVETLPEPGAMVELPLPPPERFQDNAIFVYRSIFHHRQIVNGYSGFAPPSYGLAYRQLMRRDFLRGLRAMESKGVRYVLAHEGRLGPRMKRQIHKAVDSGLLELVAEESSDRLYAITVRGGSLAPEASRSRAGSAHAAP